MDGNVFLVSEKVITLFLVLFAGIIAKKTNIIDSAATKKMSAMLLTVTQPFMIITSFQIDFDPGKLKDGFMIITLSTAIHIFTAAAAFLVYRPLRNFEHRKIYEMSTIFSNCAFLGFPVLTVIFGSDGIFYGVFYTIFFNIFIWTYGIYLMTRKNKTKKSGEKINISVKNIFLNAGMIASVIGIVIFICGIKLPAILYNSAKLIGDMTFPLSMIIIGSLIADIKLKDMFSQIGNYYYVFMKLIFFPVFIAVVCYLLKLPTLLIYIGAIMTAMPSAANSAIFAETYGADSKTAATVVGLSTLLSIGTIPFTMYFLNNILRL